MNPRQGPQAWITRARVYKWALTPPGSRHPDSWLQAPCVLVRHMPGINIIVIVELKTVECIDVGVYTYRAWVWGRMVLA